MDYELMRKSLRRAQEHLDEAVGRHLLASEEHALARRGASKEEQAKAEKAVGTARTALVQCAAVVAALKESLK